MLNYKDIKSSMYQRYPLIKTMKNILKNNNGSLAYILAIVFVLLITLKLLVNFHPLAKNTQNVIIQGNEKVISIDKSLQ